MRPPASVDVSNLTESELLRMALADGDFRRASAAAAELARRAPTEAATLDALAQGLTNADGIVQRRAALALAAFGARAAPVAPALIAAADSASWPVREAVMGTLAALVGNCVEVSDALVRLTLHDPVAHVRVAAATALAGRADAVTALRQGLTHPYPKVRCRALAALSGFQAQRNELLPSFVEALSESHAKVRRAATEALGACGAAALPAVPALLRRLRDGDSRVRAAAEVALNRMRGLLAATGQRVFDCLAKPESAEDCLRNTLCDSALSEEVRHALLLACVPSAQNTDSPWQVIAPLLDAAEVAWIPLAPGRDETLARAQARERQVLRLIARLWDDVLKMPPACVLSRSVVAITASQPLRR